MVNLLEIFFVFLKLGLTSFGGPIAHLGYFHDEFVSRRKWVNEQSYADLVALCQFLPGPASSQVGIAIGLSRAGFLGGALAWLGFTLPSALILILFAFGISHFGDQIGQGYLHGLKIVAVAVVAQAIWGMAVKLCPDKWRATVAIVAALIVLNFNSGFSQVGVIVISGIFGWLYLRQYEEIPHIPLKTPITPLGGGVALVIFFGLLIFIPLASHFSQIESLKLFDSFFRVGSLVFGGGHVVLPLLQSEVVSAGWVSNEAFLAGYGAAQAIPGPLFTFAAYLGAISKGQYSGWVGALICLVAVFLPSYLLVVGVMPFWEKFRKIIGVRFAMHGVNAAVVGLLLSAFYHPVWTSGILSPQDFGLAVGGFLLLVFWKAPSWLVVLLSALIEGCFG